MRVLLDTNVIIAAFASRGLCNALFESCIGAHEIIMCEKILDEVSEKLKHKLRLPEGIIRQILLLLRTHAILVVPVDVAQNAVRDKKDLMVLGAALTGKVRYIVTGDKDLLAIGTYKDVTIITPRSFWEKMKEQR